MLVIIGNSEISTQTSTRLRKSKPHQKPISGTMARIGTVCSTTAQGNSERSTQRACDIATATPMPSTDAISRPTNATRAVSQVASRISRRVSPSKIPCSTTACGGGSRKRRCASSSTYVAKYQTAITRPATMSGGPMTESGVPQPARAGLVRLLELRQRRVGLVGRELGQGRFVLVRGHQASPAAPRITPETSRTIATNSGA